MNGNNTCSVRPPTPITRAKNTTRDELKGIPSDAFFFVPTKEEA